MQKKNGYLSVIARKRKNVINLYGGNSYDISEHTMECGNFIAGSVGIIVAELPEAKAGRKFWFKTTSTVAGVKSQIEIRPYGDMSSTDKLSASAGTLLAAGASIISGDTGNLIIELECLEDGVWTCVDHLGSWAIADRAFVLTITHHLGTQDAFIGNTGASVTNSYDSLILDLYVRNDTFVAPDPVTDPFPNVTIADDLAAVSPPESATYIDAHHIRLEIGDPTQDDIIARSLDTDLLLSNGDTDILIAAGSMTGAEVAAGEITIDIAGLKDYGGSMDNADEAATPTFVIDVLNDTYKADIANFPNYITFTGDYSTSGLAVASVTRTSATRLTITTTGTVAYATGSGSLHISHLAFVGDIKTSKVSQQLDGTITA